MRWPLMVVALVVALALASMAVAAGPELGKQVYAKKCASCHGADGKGNAKMASMLKVTIPDLTAAAAAKPEAEVRKAVVEGKKPMPSFGKSLSKDEIDAVVQYTKRLGAGK